LTLIASALTAIVAVIVAASHADHHRPARGANHRPARGAAHPTGSAKTRSVAPAPLPRMLGQMIVTRFAGVTPSASLLARIRSGEVGGVILFADNFGGGLEEARSLIDELQRTAHGGGNPPLLVMTDQEGGEVNRITGPPTLAPSEMTSAATAREQGKAAGSLLRSVGVNVDLAPVADVERVSGSFLGTRAFGTAADACAFARGVASEHVAYTLKHFPGLGRAGNNTDLAPVSVDVPADALRSDYGAFRTCGRGPLALVMISSAIYPQLTGPLPAVMSPLTYERELPHATGGSRVLTISDDLQARALADQDAPGRHAIDAGLDLLMYAGTEQASADAYGKLLAEARSGLVSRTRIRAAYAAIVAFKRAREG
jgi:beta-N-acetylhexosaminidase